MSKELKALEKMKYIVTWENGEYRLLKSLCREEIKLIENALKEQWLYKQDYERVMNEKNSLLEEYKKNQKKLKALEIIKEKRVNVHLLILSDSLEKYNFNLLPYRKLTQEEYELLKEVLS